MKKLTVAQRSKMIRAATPGCLEELFEMQNRICDLCNKPIQDLVLAHLDHSTPVIYFARNLEMPIVDAISKCNHPSNLRAAHSVCNHKKLGMTRESWFEKGKDKIVNDITIYGEEELLNIKKRIIDASRKGGLVGGKISVDSGHMVYMSSRLSAEQMEKNGKTQGDKNAAIPGRMSAMSRNRSYESRQAVGRRVQELKAGIFSLTPEEKINNCKAGGLVAGQIAKQTGQIQSLLKVCEQEKTGIFAPGKRAEGGRISGRQNVENGHMEKMRHGRCHVKRNIIKQGCRFCEELCKTS